MPVDQTYFKSPTESEPEYNTRIATYNADKAKTEPAVISSSSVDEEIAANKDKLAAVSKKGMTAGADGSMQYADGSVAGAPEGSTYNESTGKYEYSGKTYSAAEFYDPNNQDADFEAVHKLFEPLKAATDASTLSAINAIHSQFNSLRSSQEEANQQEVESSTAALLHAGGRYTPQAMNGRILAETSYGLRQIQNLDDQENAALAKAKAAQDTEDYKLMSDMLDIAEGIRKDKQTKADNLMTKVSEANQKIAEAKYQASRDTAIADIVSQGIHDTSQILDILNSYEDGTDTGGNFTADEVSKVLKALTVDGDPDKLPADIKTFNYIRDNFGLPDEIAKLPPNEQYFAYLRSIKSSSGGGFTLSKGQTRYDENGDPITSRAGEGDEEVPTWEGYLDAAKKSAGVSYFPTPDEELLKQQYEGDFPGGKAPTKFSDTETRKLEQAGLLHAPRKEQLDFLYNKNTDLAAPDFG